MRGEERRRGEGFAGICSGQEEGRRRRRGGIAAALYLKQAPAVRLGKHDTHSISGGVPAAFPRFISLSGAWGRWFRPIIRFCEDVSSGVMDVLNALGC